MMMCDTLINAHVISFLTETGYRFSESHEWVSLAGNKATIGVTNYAEVSELVSWQ